MSRGCRAGERAGLSGSGWGGAGLGATGVSRAMSRKMSRDMSRWTTFPWTSAKEVGHFEAFWGIGRMQSADQAPTG